jgi:hypothetical protein
MGSQRIVSKLGDLDSYGQDPRRIAYAGSGVDGTSKEQILKNEVNNYGFKEAYILPTTSEQDKKVIEAFKQNMNEGYNLLTNQCAQVVQKSLNAAGINILQDVFHFYDGMTSTGFWTKKSPYSPANTFNTIRNNNPNGQYIKRKK